MNYYLMEPPFEVKLFEEMTKKEAKQHFEWFVSQVPSRLEQLRNAFEVTGEKKGILDYSPESLKALWGWFIPLISTERKSSKELEEESKKFPDWVRANLGDRKLSTGTLAMAVDIGIYFAEVLRKSNNTLKWGIPKSRAKSYINYNKTVLLGFKTGKYDTELDQSRTVHALTLKVAFHGDINPNALLKAYNNWSQKIAN